MWMGAVRRYPVYVDYKRGIFGKNVCNTFWEKTKALILLDTSPITIPSLKRVLSWIIYLGMCPAQ